MKVGKVPELRKAECPKAPAGGNEVSLADFTQSARRSTEKHNVLSLGTLF